MSEDIQNINIHETSNASLIAAEAIRTAKELAVKTELTTNRLTDTMGKLSDAVIRLGSNLEHMQKDVGDIKLNLENKYVTDEAFAPVKAQGKDHESRLRKVEYRLALAFGGLAIIQILVPLITHFIK